MKDKHLAAVLAIIFGGFGIHRFYLGQVGLGLLYVLFFWTGIPAVIGFFEGLHFLFTNQRGFDLRYNPEHVEPQQVVVQVDPAQVGAAGASSADPNDPYAQIERLHRLRKQGALSEAEFNAEKQRILAERSRG